jgi:hypothetical protein
MMLSKYFSLAELIHSQTAIRKNIDNTPSPEVLANLADTAREADRMREFLGYPVMVTSGYRSPKLNAAVGSKPTSSHTSGYALDIVCPGYGTPSEVFNALKTSGLAFDQLILEFPDSKTGGWVHIGYSPRMRREYLVFDGKTYRMA